MRLIALLLLVSSINAADTAQRVTLNDGRVLEGAYDEATGRMSLGGGAVLTLKPEDIASIEAIPMDAKADQKRAISKLKQERQGALLNLREAESHLGRNPEQRLADCDAGIAAMTEAEPNAIKRARELADGADAYARQIALVESTTTAHSQEKAAGGAAAVDTAGRPVAAAAAALTDEVSITAKDLPAAHIELEKMRSEVARAVSLAKRIHERKAQLEADKADIIETQAAVARWKVRLAEIDKSLSAP